MNCRKRETESEETNMILDDILEYRKKQLAYEKEVLGEKQIMDKAAEDERIPYDFAAALQKKGLSVIAEVKKASPSKGVIREDFTPVGIAQEYEKAGADALSVLTEEHYFKGSSQYLQAIRSKVRIPILRKDFIIDEYQLYESLVIGADAVLLIAAILDEFTITRFLRIADTLGLQCLVEAHNKEELQKAVDAGGRMIGINNRDLKTFDVDLHTTQELAKLVPEGRIIVSESGITTNNDMKQAASYGADAVLIGETLMRSADSGQELKSLREGV